MTKIQKIGADGKQHYYWQYTPEEIAVMKQKAEERRKQKEEAAKKQQEAQTGADLQETSG